MTGLRFGCRASVSGTVWHGFRHKKGVGFCDFDRPLWIAEVGGRRKGAAAGGRQSVGGELMWDCGCS